MASVLIRLLLPRQAVPEILGVRTGIKRLFSLFKTEPAVIHQQSRAGRLPLSATQVQPSPWVVRIVFRSYRQTVHVQHLGYQHEKRRMLLLAVKVVSCDCLLLKTHQPATHLRVLLLPGLQLPKTLAQTISHSQPLILHQAPGQRLHHPSPKGLQDLNWTLYQWLPVLWSYQYTEINYFASWLL